LEAQVNQTRAVSASLLSESSPIFFLELSAVFFPSPFLLLGSCGLPPPRLFYSALSAIFPSPFRVSHNGSDNLRLPRASPNLFIGTCMTLMIRGPDGILYVVYLPLQFYGPSGVLCGRPLLAGRVVALGCYPYRFQSGQPSLIL